MRLYSRITVGVAALAVGTAAPATAQDGFLFEEPRVTVTVRGGHHVAAASSDIYDFFTDELTLSRGDFSGFALAADLGIRLSSHADIVVGIGRTATTQGSEFRDWVGEDDLPIEQTTSLERVPITATLKVYPLARGRSIGSNAWVPARLTPFVGAGAGAMHYELSHGGEFVDFETFEIFPDHFGSAGWTQSMHVLAGADYWLSTRFGLTGEGRYTWAAAPLQADFRRFDDIDLRGFQATAGISIRF